MPLNECAQSHVKVRSIAFVQWHAKCGGVLVRARAHSRSMLKCTIGALEPKVSMMNFKTHRQDPSN
jgi:hypothetical protein